MQAPAEEVRLELRHADEALGALQHRTEDPLLDWTEGTAQHRRVTAAVEGDDESLMSPDRCGHRRRCDQRVVPLTVHDVPRITLDEAIESGREVEVEVGRPSANLVDAYAFDRLFADRHRFEDGRQHGDVVPASRHPPGNL